MFHDVTVIRIKQITNLIQYGQGNDLVPAQFCQSVGGKACQPAKISLAEFLINQ